MGAVEIQRLRVCPHSCLRPGFRYHHLHANKQLPVVPAPGDLSPPLSLNVLIHTCRHLIKLIYSEKVVLYSLQCYLKNKLDINYP